MHSPKIFFLKFIGNRSDKVTSCLFGAPYITRRKKSRYSLRVTGKTPHTASLAPLELPSLLGIAQSRVRESSGCILGNDLAWNRVVYPHLNGSLKRYFFLECFLQAVCHRYQPSLQRGQGRLKNGICDFLHHLFCRLSASR